jgi:hypothetical protein
MSYPALASSPTQAMAEFGFIGTFSTNCSGGFRVEGAHAAFSDKSQGDAILNVQFSWFEGSGKDWFSFNLKVTEVVLVAYNKLKISTQFLSGAIIDGNGDSRPFPPDTGPPPPFDLINLTKKQDDAFSLRINGGSFDMRKCSN